METEEADPRGRALSPALVIGWGMARWGYVRTRQLGPALVLGLVVAVAAHAGGPLLQALLQAWSAALELLLFPGSDPG
jgi:hypothetical protein